MTQYERNELARQARESGLCMKCGKPIEDREALTKDGKTYASCKDCRPSKKPRVNLRDVQNPKPPKVDDPEDLFSTPFWTQFEQDVESMVPRTRALSLRVIKARFRDRYERDFLDRYTGIALGRLESFKWVRVVWGVPPRYTTAPPIVRSIPLSEAKPFQPSPRYYKVNEQPAGMPPRLSI